MKYAAVSIAVMLRMNMMSCLNAWFPSWYGLWKYARSRSKMMMNVIPEASKITASMRVSIPSIARRIGSMVSATNQRSFLTMLECIFIEPPTSATSPSMSVKSAMLLPRRVPIPISGAPSSALMTEMSVSGRAETSATTMKEVTNSVR